VDELTRKIKPIFGFTEAEIASDIDRDVGKILTDSTEAYEYYVDALRLQFERKFEESNGLLKKAVDLDTEFAMAYFEMSTNYLYLAQPDQAEKFILKSLDYSDRLSDKEYYLLQGYVSDTLLKSPKKALENYKKILELYPNDDETYMLIAAVYRNIEEWDLSIENCEKVLSINPNNDIAYNNLSLIYTAKGLYDKAVEVMDSNKEHFTNQAFIPKFKCYAFFGMGKYDLAFLEVENLLALDPDNPDSIRLKGNLYHAKGDLPEAEKIYRELSRRDNPLIQSEAHLWIAQLYLMQGLYEKCEKEIKQGIENSQNSGLIEYELEFLLLNAYLSSLSGNLSQALDAANKAMEIALQNNLTDHQKLTYLLRGMIYVDMNRLDEAEKNAAQLKELIEKTDNEKHMRHYYHLMGMIALKTGEISDALVHFEQAVSLLPSQVFHLRDHALYLDSLARTYYVIRDIEKAQHQYEKIASLTISKLRWGDIYARSLYWLGKIYQGKGWEGKAVEQYEKFLELWKSADSDIPEVRDTRKQLQELTETSRVKTTADLQ